jgi:HD-like signal output (HDOD) protein/CheY-like chemotaxis protein
MKRILFVDDESEVLSALRRLLRTTNGEWELAFAGGGAEALELCAGEQFDLVVSDAQMPGVSGAELLKEFRRRCPDTVRFVLSGQFRWDLAVKSVGVAHQFFNKPCDPWVLMSAARRVGALRAEFPDVAARQTVASIHGLPSQSTAYRKLVDRMNSSRACIESVTEIIACDAAMIARTLHLVSSGFFGTPTHVTSPAHAVKLLGLRTIKALLDSPEAFRLDDSTLHREEELRLLNDHSLAVARAAKLIAETVSADEALIGDAYLAGVLHEIGPLAQCGNPFAPRPSTVPTHDDRAGSAGVWAPADRQLIGPDIGGYLAAIWGLADPIVQAIAYHGAPRIAADQTFSPLTAVHVAHTLVKPLHSSASNANGAVDFGYIESTGYADRLESWREICAAGRPETVLQ